MYEKCLDKKSPFISTIVRKKIYKKFLTQKAKYSIPNYCLARQNSFIVRAPWVVQKQRESTGHCLTTFLRKNVSYAGRQLRLKTLTMGTVKNRYDISVTQTHLMDSSFCTLRLTKLSCIGYGYLRQLMFKIWL